MGLFLQMCSKIVDEQRTPQQMYICFYRLLRSVEPSHKLCSLSCYFLHLCCLLGGHVSPRPRVENTYQATDLSEGLPHASSSITVDHGLALPRFDYASSQLSSSRLSKMAANEVPVLLPRVT